MIDVSVIIPAHNRERLIERALSSVLAQTYSGLEVIVVDDGSLDGTSQKVLALRDEDSRIRLLKHSANLGAQAARNKGSRAAKGRWLAFLDSDDQWLPDSLEKRLYMAEEKSVEVVHSDCYVVRQKGEAFQLFSVPPFKGKTYRDLLKRPGPFFQGLLITKKALEGIGYLDETIVSYQEWDTAIRLAEKYEFEFVPDPTFIYYCDHECTISKDMRKGARGYEQVFTKHMRSILFNLGPSALSTHYLNAANFYREANEIADANRCFVLGGLIWPFRPKGILKVIKRHLDSNI
jgi:glycosyltransferase involved in cell wall biosynthesis